MFTTQAREKKRPYVRKLKKTASGPGQLAIYTKHTTKHGGKYI